MMGAESTLNGFLDSRKTIQKDPHQAVSEDGGHAPQGSSKK